MLNARNNQWCLFVAAGSLLSATGAFATPPDSTGEPGEVASTFDANGAFDHEGVAKVDIEAARPKSDEPQDETLATVKREAMDRQLAAVFAQAPLKSDAATPNFRYLRGVAVPMHLDSFRLLVKAPNQDAAKAAVVAAGLVIAAEGHSTVNGYTLVALALPLADVKAADNVVQRVIANGVSFAGPVFQNPFIEGGIYTPTERALVRVNEGVDPVVAAARLAGTFRVTNPLLGDMAGAMELTTTEKNGFRVMAAINAMAQNPQFRWAHPSAIQSLVKEAYEPTDPLWNFQWGHRNTGGTYNGLNGVSDRDMDTDLAWDLQRGTTSVISLVMDDGIQTNHPDLVFLDGRDFTTGAANGVGNGAHSTSCERHGTSVSGCIAETLDNELGATGTAPGTRVIMAKIADINGGACSNSFDAYESVWVVNALDWGRDYGARISNASFSVGQDDAISDMYTNTWTSGVVHFASAGNGGSDGVGDPQVVFPSSAPNVISVAALEPNGTLTNFSNYGTGLDLAAPGTAVYSTDRTGTGGYTSGDYTYFGGTSAASPMAAGVAALFFSQHPFATASQCRTAVYNGCVDLGAAGFDTFYARGFTNAYNTMTEYSPTNDTCSGATVIPSNAYNPANVNVRWATSSLLEPDEACGSSFNNNSVFYRFTPPNSGVLNINTNGSDYDTVLSVFEGCVLFLNGIRLEPTELACDDDSGTGLQSQLINIPVSIDNSVTIKVAKFGGASGGGDLDFNFSFTATPPSNDSCSTATVITDPGTGDFSYRPPLADTDLATTSACEPDEDCGATTNSNSVYYRFTPEHDGVISIDTAGSDYDTVLSVFEGCTFNINGFCIQPAELGCNDDSGGFQSALSNIPVEAGNSVVIKVADYNAEGGGRLDFNFDYSPTAPTNDSCSNATTIPSAIGLFDPPPADVFYATSTFCENDDPCVGTTSHSVWYRFRAPTNGRIFTNTVGSDFNTVMSIYNRCAFTLNGQCIDYTALACNDNASIFTNNSAINNFDATSGITYLIKVSLNGSAFPGISTGAMDFEFEFLPDCPSDWDFDGDSDSDDIVSFFADWDNGEGDADGDGDTDSDDVIEFFNRWEAGC